MAFVSEVSIGDAAWTRGRRYGVLGILSLLTVINFVDRQVISILIEPIKRDLHVSDSIMGLLTGLPFALFYVVAGIPMARLADTGVRRTLLAACAGFWSAMTALCGLAGNFVQLLLTRIGVAVGESGGAPFTQSLVSDIFPKSQRATIFGILTASQAIGMALGVFIGGWLNMSVGWRMVFILTSLPGFLLALVLLMFVPEPRRGMADNVVVESAKSESIWLAIGAVWADAVSRWILIALSFAGFAGYSFLSWGPTFMIRSHGMTTGSAGLGIGLAIFSGLSLGSLVAGPLSDFLGRQNDRFYLIVSAVGILLSIPAGLGFLHVSEPQVALVCFFLFTLCIAFIQPPSMALLMTRTGPVRRGAASFLTNLAYNLFGVGIGSFGVGVISDALTEMLAGESLRGALTMTMASGAVCCAGAFLWGARAMQKP